jgi:hypothetical protein
MSKVHVEFTIKFAQASCHLSEQEKRKIRIVAAKQIMRNKLATLSAELSDCIVTTFNVNVKHVAGKKMSFSENSGGVIKIGIELFSFDGVREIGGVESMKDDFAARINKIIADSQQLVVIDEWQYALTME